MDKLLFSVIVGLLLGLIDIVPMLIKKLPKFSIIAAFIQIFIASVVIINSDIPHIAWWLQGGLLGLLMMIPMLIHVGHTDKKPLPIIATNAIVLGTIAKFASYFLLTN